MKAQRPYPTITITPKGERALLGGHPWVYDTEITAQSGPIADGAVADVLSAKGRWLGSAFYNSHSKIRGRLISRNANDTFNEAFWRRRLQYAWDYRKSVLAPEDLSCCRVIFGEADAFPGLTVDRFNDILVVQILSLGMEQRKKMLLRALVDILRADGQTIRGVYERNDVGLREKEGLTEGKGWFPLPGETPPEGRLARGKTVLDCFTHTGSFALNAALGGAKHVTAVDVSETAVALARENAVRNGLEHRMDFQAANVFDLLPRLAEGPKQYDFIILDPPAFTKSRKTIRNAMTGYKEINYRAMKLLPRGGYLATCSCSHFAYEDLFLKMLHSAASDAGVQLRQIEARQQCADHPILWGVPETNYLKFYLFQVI